MNSTFGLTEDEKYLVLDISDDSPLNDALTDLEEDMFLGLIEKIGKHCHDTLKEPLTYVKIEAIRKIEADNGQA